MEKVVRMTGAGGIDQLDYAAITLPAPGPQEVLVRQTAIGVNFIDIYHRSGLYPLPLPAVLGVEAAGVIEAMGAGVEGLRIGDRIAYAGAPVGAYATARNLPAGRAIKLPDAVTDQQAAGSLLKGLTAHMLLTRIYPVGADNIVLILGAAGGLGSMMTQWAKLLGARVIGTVGSDAKAKLARDSGADEVIVGRDADLPTEIARLTDGRGVDVAYDGIGGSGLLQTLDCVRPFGMVASIGQAAGPIPPLAVEALGPRRSLSFARPSVMAHTSDPATYRTASAAVMDLLAQGLAPMNVRNYPLADAATAQSDLEAGRTTGSLILLP